MLIDSDNPKIKGDARIMEILVKKEEQALKNIRVVAMALGKGAHAIHQSGKWYTNENIA